MQTFARRSLFWKYAGYFAGLVSLLLVISGAVGGWFAYRASVAALEEVQLATAHYAAKEIAIFMRGVRDALHFSAGKFDVFADPDTNDMRLELGALLRYHPEISELRLISPSGREQFLLSRFGVTVAKSGRDVSGDPAFVATRAALDHVGPVHFLKETEPYVSVGAARDHAGGVLVAEVNLKFIWDMVAQAHLKSGGVAYVVDSDGQLISHPDMGLILGKTNLSSLPHVRRALAQRTNAGVLVGEARDIQGRSVVSTAVPVPDLGWTVFAEQSLQEAFRPVYASIARSVVLVLLGVAAAVATSVLLARRMVRPIHEIETRARQLGRGQFEQRITLHTGDELEALATQFNRMAERLQETHTMQEARIAERTRDLAVANEAKTRFLAAASHDLRQPIHALALFIGQLRMVALPKDAEALAECVEQSVDSLRELLEALLDLSKLDIGAVRAEPRAMPLQALLSRLQSQFASTAKAKGLSLKVVKTSLWACSDPLLLERIVLNLVANSVRYTERGRVLIGCRRRGDHVEVTVADTGIGIDPDDLPHVFQEFYRAAGRGNGMGAGLGLGLAIVHRLALLLGHRIAIDSIPGKGTVVRLLLKRTDPQMRATEPRTAVLDGLLQGKRVLVVDDEASVRTAIHGLLSRWGCEVVEAAGSAEALAHARRRCPDIVLCDLNLTRDENGVTLVDMLERECAQGLVCAFVTGESSPDRIAEARATGHPIILKPTSAGKLRAMLEHLVSFRQA
ncbi:ATP-binding protein [Variovorax robiniae]|uniref:histidine kinase n=1 Tax=Variovorax robiniae TaxID=1836199 RepID=A0ABU8X5Q5_9BURK